MTDNVNSPSHYFWLKDKCGIEVIDITRHLDFDLGNAIKYLLRAGHKKDASLTDKQKEVEDLKKAIWYIKDKISILEGSYKQHYVCSQCGSDVLAKQAWVDLNTNEWLYDVHDDNTCWCDNCNKEVTFK